MIPLSIDYVWYGFWRAIEEVLAGILSSALLVLITILFKEMGYGFLASIIVLLLSLSVITMLRKMEHWGHYT